MNHQENFDLVIVGGLGHVGLPLGLAFTNKDKKVCLFDINRDVAETVKKGEMPFIEYGAEPLLKRALKKNLLTISNEEEVLSQTQILIIALGTPVDEYLNPKTRNFLEFFRKVKKNLRPEQLIIIRSTVYPQTAKQLWQELGEKESWKIAYCPERIAQGYSIKELEELPQIVSGLSEEAVSEAEKLFSLIAPKIIRTSISEAELVKLFCNAWRYIQFAVTNQFFMISERFGVNYDRVRDAMVNGYGRASSLPGPGFAAGPCLLKDTMQLAAFESNQFFLGHAAMMVNEGLPQFLVESLRKRHDLKNKPIGILGMAFKADIDDPRDSLSYKLGKILRFHGAKVQYSDEFVKDPTFISKEKLINQNKIIFVGIPHSAYKDLVIPSDKEVIDLWDIVQGGIRPIR